MAVSAHTALTYAPAPGSTIRLTSDNFPGEVLIDLNRLERLESGGAQPDSPSWSRYVAAAALVLRHRLPDFPTGIRGHVHGTLPGGGLSSSASVLLAYISALADVNDIHLSPEDKVDLALRAEHEFVGIKVGILDPAVIVGARRGELLCIDSRARRWEGIPLGERAPRFQILVAASGVTRNLAGTDYNRRVEECFAACAKLANLAGIDDVNGLHDLDDAVFEEHRESLPLPELRRARHFFTERARVGRGIDLWRQGDIEGFGQLMNASCQSSIDDWEAGSPELIELQRILTETPGVYGSRFSGAGFGGCVVALVDDFDAVASHIPGRVFRVESDDGVRLL
jgi:galactokinase